MEHNAFTRYWNIVEPVESISTSAVGPCEEEVAKALLAALEYRLVRLVSHSRNVHAPTVVEMLAAKLRRRAETVKGRWRDELQRLLLSNGKTGPTQSENAAGRIFKCSALATSACFIAAAFAR